MRVEIVIHDVFTTSHVFKINGMIFFKPFGLSATKVKTYDCVSGMCPDCGMRIFCDNICYIKCLMVEKCFPSKYMCCLICLGVRNDGMKNIVTRGRRRFSVDSWVYDSTVSSE